jgi:hypothetical protein
MKHWWRSIRTEGGTSQATVIFIVTTERTPNLTITRLSELHSLLRFKFLAPWGCYSEIQVGCPAVQMAIDRNWRDRLAAGARTIVLFKIIATESIPYLCKYNE